MRRPTPPPIGYFVTDYEKEIRAICSFLEDEGMQFVLVSEFEIRYVSKALIIFITFERYGETVWIEYAFPDDVLYKDEHFEGNKYDVGWTIELYNNGAEKEKYKDKEMGKLKIISACMRFFEDHRALLMDKDFSEKMRMKYETIEE